MTQQPDVEAPFERVCARTGESRPGKFYVLKTTDGEELVSEDAFWGTPVDADQDDVDADVDVEDQDDQEVAAAVAKHPAGKGRVPAQRKGK